MMVNLINNMFTDAPGTPNPGVMARKINPFGHQNIWRKTNAQKLLKIRQTLITLTKEIINLHILLKKAHVYKSCLEADRCFKEPRVPKH